MADLQQLIKLKNQSLSELQKSATGGAPDATPAGAPAARFPRWPPLRRRRRCRRPLAHRLLRQRRSRGAAPVPASTSPTVAPSSPGTPATTAGDTTPAANALATTPAATTPAPAPAATPAPAPVKPAAAPVSTAVERSWSDWVMDNLMLVVGLLLLLLLVGGYAVSRRRKLSRFEDSIFVDNSVLHANSVFGTTGGQSVDTANSGFHSNFVPVAGNLPEHSEVDPVAEADVYIAYGRDAQAEEILKEALRADGTRNAVRLKLLEIYAKRGDAKTFETMASELYASTGGQGDDWRQAAALGAGIDPHKSAVQRVGGGAGRGRAARGFRGTLRGTLCPPGQAEHGVADQHRVQQCGARLPYDRPQRGTDRRGGSGRRGPRDVPHGH